MKVPYFDFNAVPHEIRQEWKKSIEEVLSAGQFIGGSFVGGFEKAWAEYLQVNHAVGVGNGLDALVLSLRALNITTGSRVAVPSHTFMATWLAVESVGATPVGVDVDARGLIDLDLLESLNQRLDAVIPVHLHGQMVDMKRLTEWAFSRNIKVVEDCAQAHGAALDGKYAGTWGDIGAYSFYPTKNLGALGDAGSVVTNNPELARKIRSLGNYGTVAGDKYNYESFGINSRLDPVQAGVLKVNLKHLENWNSRRREIASQYLGALIPKSAKLLTWNLEQSVWHHFVLLTPHREILKQHLLDEGIQTEIHYPQCAGDAFSALKGVASQDFKKGRRISETTISLPIHPWITDDQVDYVVAVLGSEKSLNLLN